MSAYKYEDTVISRLSGGTNGIFCNKSQELPQYLCG